MLMVQMEKGNMRKWKENMCKFSSQHSLPRTMISSHGIVSHAPIMAIEHQTTELISLTNNSYVVVEFNIKKVDLGKITLFLLKTIWYNVLSVKSLGI